MQIGKVSSLVPSMGKAKKDFRKLGNQELLEHEFSRNREKNVKEPAIRDAIVGRSGMPSYAIVNGKVCAADGFQVKDAHYQLVGKVEDAAGNLVSERAVIGGSSCLGGLNGAPEKISLTEGVAGHRQAIA